MNSKKAAKSARSAIESLPRVTQERRQVVKELRSPGARESLENLEKPKSISKGLRNLGAALLLCPDPFTGVPGAVLLASAYALKKREPLPMSSVAAETRKLLRDLQSSLV